MSNCSTPYQQQTYCASRRLHGGGFGFDAADPPDPTATVEVASGTSGNPRPYRIYPTARRGATTPVLGGDGVLLGYATNQSDCVAPCADCGTGTGTGGTGQVGPQGPVGPTGPQGPQGPMGYTGPAGPTGPIGPQGSVGPAGADGAPGTAGVAGPAGVPGQAGATGPQGAKGDTGAQGIQGPIGPAGPAGATGATGPAGPAGVNGAAGAAGAAGPAGPAGADGLSAYEVAVAGGFVGTEAQWLATLVGPAGAAGATGPAGPTTPATDTVLGAVTLAVASNYPEVTNDTEVTTPAYVMAAINAVMGPTLAGWLAFNSASPSDMFVGAITYDVNYAPTASNIIWPDGGTGTYVGTPSTTYTGQIDSYVLTYVAPATGPWAGLTKTITQPAVTRDSTGQVTLRPARTIV